MSLQVFLTDKEITPWSGPFQWLLLMFRFRLLFQFQYYRQIFLPTFAWLILVVNYSYGHFFHAKNVLF